MLKLVILNWKVKHYWKKFDKTKNPVYREKAEKTFEDFCELWGKRL